MTCIQSLLSLYEDKIHLFTILDCLDKWISKRFDDYMREMDQDELADDLTTPEPFLCIDKISLGDSVEWFPTPALRYKRMVEKYENEMYDYPTVYDSWLDFISKVEINLKVVYEKYRITYFLPCIKDLLSEVEKVLPLDDSEFSYRYRFRYD